MFKKSFVLLLIATSFSTVSAATTEIECSSDPVFSEYSCNQCFDGGVKNEGGYIGLLTDEWRNTSSNEKIMYKEQQDFPEMINLDTDNIEWVQTPGEEDFWEYTDEFNNLYSEDQDGYVLKAGAAVTWIKSKLGYAYKLERNEASTDSNIGLLIYPLLTHSILDNGEITMDNSVYNECVLLKSGEPTEETIIETKKLPQTGPAEFMLLLILSMVLAFGVVRFKNS